MIKTVLIHVKCIVGANWAVGSIFGVWEGKGFMTKCGYDQAAAAYSVYGPRTTLVIARPRALNSRRGIDGAIVQEFVFAGPSKGWVLSKADITVAPAMAVFAPANLRASASDNTEYRDLIQYWLSKKYTIRYSGGLVPDLNHILAKVSYIIISYLVCLHFSIRLAFIEFCFLLYFLMMVFFFCVKPDRRVGACTAAQLRWIALPSCASFTRLSLLHTL
jgi:hypothetical protein